MTLSENFGKSVTVLLFFPAAFSGVCTEELCSVSGGLAGFDAGDAVVNGVSSDSPFAQEAWAKQDGIIVPRLSNYTLAVAEAYQVLLDDFIGLGPSNHRAVIVVDKE